MDYDGEYKVRRLMRIRLEFLARRGEYKAWSVALHYYREYCARPKIYGGLRIA